MSQIYFQLKLFIIIEGIPLILNASSSLFTISHFTEHISTLNQQL